MLRLRYYLLARLALWRNSMSSAGTPLRGSSDKFCRGLSACDSVSFKTPSCEHRCPAPLSQGNSRKGQGNYHRKVRRRSERHSPRGYPRKHLEHGRNRRQGNTGRKLQVSSAACTWRGALLDNRTRTRPPDDLKTACPKETAAEISKKSGKTR